MHGILTLICSDFRLVTELETVDNRSARFLSKYISILPRSQTQFKRLSDQFINDTFKQFMLSKMRTLSCSLIFASAPIIERGVSVKGLAILCHSFDLPRPTLLSVRVLDGFDQDYKPIGSPVNENDPFAVPARKIVELLREVMAEYGIDPQNLKSISGEHAAINLLVAQQLGVECCGCMSHSLDLIIRAIVGSFPVVVETLINISIITHSMKSIGFLGTGVSAGNVNYFDSRFGKDTEILEYLLMTVAFNGVRSTRISRFRDWINCQAPSDAAIGAWSNNHRLRWLHQRFSIENVFQHIVLLMRLVFRLIKPFYDLIKLQAKRIDEDHSMREWRQDLNQLLHHFRMVDGTALQAESDLGQFLQASAEFEANSDVDTDEEGIPSQSISDQAIADFHLSHPTPSIEMELDRCQCLGVSDWLISYLILSLISGHSSYSMTSTISLQRNEPVRLPNLRAAGFEVI